jgi:hypothetical protein
MKRTLFIAGLVCIFLLACEKDKNNIKNDNLVIKMNNICGFCAGGDSLIVTPDITCFERLSPCDDSGFKKTVTTNKSEWDELLGLLDVEKFKKIDLNTCYVCVDGCDTWIQVKNGSFSHEIRFADFDSPAVRSIQPFIDKLYEIGSRVSEN